MGHQRKPKALLFDLDDTLRPGYPIVEPMYRTFARVHKLPFSQKRLKELWGTPLPGMLTGMWPAKDVQWLLEEFKRLALKFGHRSELFAGVPETLERLSKDYLLAIVSSTAKDSLSHDPRLNLKWFEHVQAGEHSPYYKPDPRVFDAAMEKLAHRGVIEQETIYIGDHWKDLKAARARGIFFIAVLGPLTTEKEFLAMHQPKKDILPSFNDLPARLSL